jgi:transglutaminase-like putative cysteine protease
MTGVPAPAEEAAMESPLAPVRAPVPGPAPRRSGRGRPRPVAGPLLAFASLGLGLALGVFLLTVPGLRRLPQPGRTTVDGVTTLDEAVARARATGRQGWELVAFAQRLAARKVAYSRRNPWDSPARAFERGMGYCQQQALALDAILRRLGIASRPVYAMRCRFPPLEVHGIAEPAGVSGHVWLRVRVGGEERDVCCGDMGNTPGTVHFAVLSPVRTLHPWLRPLTHLGSAVENVRRDWVARRRQRWITEWRPSRRE